MRELAGRGIGPRRLPDLEPAHRRGLRRSRSIRCPQLVAAGVRCSISTDDPGDVRHRPHARLRGCAALGARSSRGLRGRARSARSATPRRSDASQGVGEDVRLAPQQRATLVTMSAGSSMARADRRRPSAQDARRVQRRPPCRAAEAAGSRKTHVLPAAAEAGTVDVRVPRARVRPAASCSSASARAQAASATSSRATGATLRQQRVDPAEDAEGRRNRSTRTRRTPPRTRSSPRSRRRTTSDARSPRCRSASCGRRTPRPRRSSRALYLQRAESRPRPRQRGPGRGAALAVEHPVHGRSELGPRQGVHGTAGEGGFDPVNKAVQLDVNSRSDFGVQSDARRVRPALVVYEEIANATPRTTRTSRSQLAQAAEAAGNVPKAITAYEKFLGSPRTIRWRRPVKQRLAQLASRSLPSAKSAVRLPAASLDPGGEPE